MVIANMPIRLRFNMVGPISEGLIRPIGRSSCCKVAVQVYWIAAGSSSLPYQAPFAHRDLRNILPGSAECHSAAKGDRMAESGAKRRSAAAPTHGRFRSEADMGRRRGWVASGADDPTYGPAVRCKGFRRSGGCGLASMYPASDWSE